MITRRNTVFAEEGKQLLFKGEYRDSIIIKDAEDIDTIKEININKTNK